VILNSFVFWSATFKEINNRIDEAVKDLEVVTVK
jgi:hypothetical protein